MLQPLNARNRRAQAQRIPADLLDRNRHLHVRWRDRHRKRDVELARLSARTRRTVRHRRHGLMRAGRDARSRRNLPARIGPLGSHRGIPLCHDKRIGINGDGLDGHLGLARVDQLDGQGLHRLTDFHRLEAQRLGLQTRLMDLVKIKERRAEVDVRQLNLEVATAYRTVLERKLRAQPLIAPFGRPRIRTSPPAVALDLGELRRIDRLARRQARIGGCRDRHPHVFAPAGNAVGVDALRPPVGERTDLALMPQIDHDPCVGTALRIRNPKLVTRAVVSVDDTVRHRHAVARRRIRVHGHLLVRHETRIALARGEGERHSLGSRRHSRCGTAHLDRAISLVRAPDIKRLPRSAVDTHLQPLDDLAVLEVDAVGAIVALDHDAAELAPGNID